MRWIELALQQRLARTNLEASIDRSNAEPGANRESMRSYSALLASSHRLAHALLALEAGLSTIRSEAPREPFRKFANDVELTLYSLAASLRGSAIAPESLPDLPRITGFWCAQAEARSHSVFRTIWRANRARATPTDS